MHTKLLTGCVIAAALFGPMAARAADGDTDREHPSTFVKDSAITTKVKAKLAEEKLQSLINVHVDTDRDGKVVLSGTVPSEAAADTAVSITRGTEGVTSVQSHLKVKKTS